MFLPRVLLKKGMRPPAKRTPNPPPAPAQAEEGTADPQAVPPTRPATLQTSESTGPESTQQTGGQAPDNEALLVRGKRKLDQTPLAEETTTVPKKAKGDQPRKGSNFTPKQKWIVNDDYLKEVTLGIEIFFSDYAHRDSTSSLNRLQKVIDGESGYIHLQTLISSRLLDRMKPYATHDIIRQALQSFPSDYVEIAQDGLHVRRKPSTYPLPFLLDEESAAIKEEEEGLSFWDSHTIYVEPSNPLLCVRPTSVAASLLKNGDLSAKLLPIQAIQVLRPSCAFVVFSGSITLSSGETWLEKGLPKDWIVMSKEEHDGRTKEYKGLVDHDRQRRAKAIEHSKIPSEARLQRKAIAKSKREQAERREARVQREATYTVGTVSDALIAFPDRWTFVRLSNMPWRLPVQTILKLVKDISPRPIESFIAFHTYGKLFVILQFAMKEDAEAIVKAFNDKVTALKETDELGNWLHRLSSEHEPRAWKDIPDKSVFLNPSSTDRKKILKRRAKAKREGTRAKILNLEEAKACWDQLQRKAGITCSGAPVSD
ncbi:uncharacterized protein BDZ99DRAFT_476268 [Mytilinidion resinicola]|uniref:HTH La-type RNA-binding domain-containing protein n=1 Tax=Mytilinidion resinicola TaxID=574789 RepID=A0A6A6YMN4_9PEZI|nr:uncharacterized protein BDZ99DRAFT_476268 [Mytilinidion resinicola]KAF2810050.1 hypothetical protein BDZ99DRAFT_476268 [Mytilinidion resinicola]